MSKKSVLPQLQRIAESPMFQVTGLALIHLDILISIAFVWMSLNDFAEPRIVSANLMIGILITDNGISTVWRNILFWSHILIRLVFLFELVVKFQLRTEKNCTKKVLITIDDAVIVIGPVLKVICTGRASIVVNFVTVLRLIQNYLFMDAIIIQNEKECYERVALIERHYESMIKNYEQRLAQSGNRLKQQEDKLKVMLGDISASDLIQ